MEYIKLFESFESINIEMIKDVLLHLLDKDIKVTVEKMNRPLLKMPKRDIFVADKDKRCLNNNTGGLTKLEPLKYYLVLCKTKGDLNELKKEFRMEENIGGSFSVKNYLYKRFEYIGLKCKAFISDKKTKTISFVIEVIC